jgi:hypothetical protein
MFLQQYSISSDRKQEEIMAPLIGIVDDDEAVRQSISSLVR